MAMVQPVTLAMKNKNPFNIRTAFTNDGFAMHQLTKEVLKEEEGLIMILQDFNMTVEDQMRKNEMYLSHPQTLTLLAEHNNLLIGILTMEPEYLIKTMHRGNLGIIIKKEYRSQGIGRAMIYTALNWAKEHRPYEKLQLEVLETNKGAIHLYEQIGFKVEGVIDKAVKHNDKHYENLIQMGLFL